MTINKFEKFIFNRTPHSNFASSAALLDVEEVQRDLARLKELNDRNYFPPMIGNTEDFVRFEMDKGNCLARNVETAEDNSWQVTLWFQTKGCKFPRHRHDQKEWIIILNGKAVIKYNGGSQKTLKAGDSLYHDPGTWHSAAFLEDSTYLTVMKPASPNYPGYNKEAKIGQ